MLPDVLLSRHTYHHLGRPHHTRGTEPCHACTHPLTAHLCACLCACARARPLCTCMPACHLPLCALLRFCSGIVEKKSRLCQCLLTACLLPAEDLDLGHEGGYAFFTDRRMCRHVCKSVCGYVCRHVCKVCRYVCNMGRHGRDMYVNMCADMCIDMFRYLDVGDEGTSMGGAAWHSVEYTRPHRAWIVSLSLASLPAGTLLCTHAQTSER